MPPLNDPPAWTPGCSMQDVDSYAYMWSCSTPVGKQGHARGCAINATMEGEVKAGEKPLADKVVADDALAKLDLGAATFHATGRPFLLSVGFRKPHMPWRFPAPWLSYYPNASEITVAARPTMDYSIPPIAHHDPTLQPSPYLEMDTALAQTNRLFYYASISWVDSQIGRVLDRLEELGLVNETLVVFHSDHGWSLGESGQWQKFTNFENGARVPLIIRAPWLQNSVGRTSSVLAELVDVYPSMLDLAGLPLPRGETLDGVSLRPALIGPAPGLKTVALSQFPRCPSDTSNASRFWKDNMCEWVERSQIFSMGYSIRTTRWRFTQWLRWDGETLQGNWSSPVIGTELYDHAGDTGAEFDHFEGVNVAADNPAVVEILSKQLREAFD